MARHGYTNVDGDCVTFIKSVHRDNGTKSRIIIGMHVDDGIVATNDERMYEQLITELQEAELARTAGMVSWMQD